MLDTKKFLADYNSIEENGGDIDITYDGLVNMLEKYHQSAKYVENGNTVYHHDGTTSKDDITMSIMPQSVSKLKQLIDNLPDHKNTQNMNCGIPIGGDDSLIFECQYSTPETLEWHLTKVSNCGDGTVKISLRD